MRETNRYKLVLNYEELYTIHELLHDELMRYKKESDAQRARLNPSNVFEAHEIEKIEEHLAMLRKLKSKFSTYD